jgi:hypothetical protein
MLAIDFSSNLGYLNSKTRWISLIQWVFGCGLGIETYWASVNRSGGLGVMSLGK